MNSLPDTEIESKPLTLSERRKRLEGQVHQAIGRMVAASRLGPDGEPVETPEHQKARQHYERLRRAERRLERKAESLLKPAKLPVVPVVPSRPRTRQHSRRRTRAASTSTSSSGDGEPPPRVSTTFATVDDATTRARAVDLIRQLLAHAEGRR